MSKPLRSAGDIEALRSEALAGAEGKTLVAVSGGTCGDARGAETVYQSFLKEVESRGLSDKVLIKKTGCHGFCEREPVVLIHPEMICYLDVKEEDAADIVGETVEQGKIVERLVWRDEQGGEKSKREEIPIFKGQMPLVMLENLKIDPNDILDYIAAGGYAALTKSLLEMSPEEVLETVKKANLRGRGGGGFPAGVKWETTKNADDPVKYVVVNADEGDPGAYMDRSVLEGNPHLVLEGLIIAGYAIGAHQGFFYVRQEYPMATEHILKAIDQARERGLLGGNILGSGFDFDVSVHRGAGAFVSGESSALMTAIEGSAGEPRLKYTRTSVKGLNEKPTNLNNVETYANVPRIIEKGAEWFQGIGTENSKGTKVFSLVGKVKNTGLVEVPMGTTLRQIIFDIGGGILDDRKFKGVQTGGPSGGVLPGEMLDLPVDFDALTAQGSMMGSGGMIVMDENSCMVDVARYFVNFLSEESCGKCTPCRDGVAEMLDVLERITTGRGNEDDIGFLEDIGELLSEGALCALGTTAANPVLSTLRYFRDEYEAHIRDKRCPALVCGALISYEIDAAKCKACGSCRKACPVDAIEGEKKKVHVIDQEKCIKCGACLQACPAKFDAVRKVSPALGTAARGAEALASAGKEGE